MLLRLLKGTLSSYSTLTVLCSRAISCKRGYADFLKGLPKVSGGVSRFRKKDETKRPKQEDGGQFSTTILSGNRFAQRYAKKPEQKWRDNKRESNFTARDGVQPDRASQYERARAALRSKEKQQGIHKNTLELKNKVSGRNRSENKVDKDLKIKIQIPTFITVANLATILGVPLSEFLKNLEALGFEGMSHNYILDKDNASLIADEYGFEVTMNDEAGADLFPSPECTEPDKLKPRAPVVTIMGHVDHGKTTILDYLRKSSIVNDEHGGITQHIGTFSVITPISKKKITFLDTPGHAAFLKMRERGAIITDIVILVVAADDSVMPQTIEAIKHAKKSSVPMIVAISKCDKPGVKPEKVLADLSSHGIDVEDYGGDTQVVQVSGKTGLNIDKLEEAVITLSETSEFKSEVSDIPAEGWIIESQVAKGLGNIATILVRRGTVKVGSFLVAGKTYCKVRGIKDENGKVIKSAGPSTPAQVWGWKEVPGAGDQVLEAKNELIAKKVCENRNHRLKQIQAARDIEFINKKRQEEIKELKRKEKLNELKMAGFDENDIEDAVVKEQEIVKLKYIVKSDVFGSAEAIKESIDGLGNEEVTSIVLSHDANVPSESDIETAKALDAKILCFNLKIPKIIKLKADKCNVDIKEYNIIYRLIEDVTSDLTSKLKPFIETNILAEIEIKDIFTISSKTKTKFKIAGCKVSTGTIKRSSKVQVMRQDEVVYDGLLSSLKHVKNDIAEAKKGSECGISFDNWDKFEKGDIIKAYEQISHQRFL